MSLESNVDHTFTVLGIVNNDITKDTRVKRVAASAAANGFDSVILGFTNGHREEHASMGAVKVIRVPVPLEYAGKGKPVLASFLDKNDDRSLKRAILYFLQPGFMKPIERLLKGVYRFVKSKPFRRSLRRVTAVAIKLLIKVVSTVPQLKSLVQERKVSRLAATAIRRVTARDFEFHYGEKILEIKPDLIHAHDFHMIGVAVKAADQLRELGHEVKVVYDAHELVEGLDHLDRPVQEYWLSYESEYIHRVDGVVCVSEPQAERLQQRYELLEKPTVILNCPVLENRENSITTIREDLQIDNKILVYHGKASKARGLETFIESLRFLNDDAHIVLVVNVDDPFVKELRALAARIDRSRSGSSQRLHFLPYVPAEDLPQYLSTADVAVIPLLPTGNHDVAMPNKLFEAIHAKLPIITSERKALAEFINSHRIGMVYADNDPNQLADKANEMLDDLSGYRSTLTDNFMKRYSWGAQSEELIRVYGKLLGAESSMTAAISHNDIILRESSSVTQ